METKHLRQIDILNAAAPYCEKLGVKLNKNDLSQYVSGKVEPGQHKLTVLGLTLNVSEAWLMGYDVPMERDANEKNPTPDIEDGKYMEFMRLFRQLPESEQQIVIDLIKSLLKERE